MTERLKSCESPDRLLEEYAWMQAQIATALEDVETSQLVKPAEVETPNHETIAKLRRRAQSFDLLRDEVLQELHKGSSDGPIHVAEAVLLAGLLHARLTLTEQREALLSPERLADTLRRDDVGIALQTVLAALKSRFVGINTLEISTCGAIPPYNTC